MQVVYTAPNRGHHYLYAEAFYNSDSLFSFVSGFSRFSPRADSITIGDKLRRVDFLQNLYLAASRYKLPIKLCAELAYRAKIEQDKACRKYIDGADIFMFYSGSGLDTLAYCKKKGVITIVEAVNSHVQFQENILADEYRELGLPWKPFHKEEKKRRLLEYEKADYILMPSEFVKKSFLYYGFPKEKLLKVPYGFNQFAHKKSEAFKKSNCFTILYVGSISVRKGLRYLIDAFNKLSHPNKKLIVTGPMAPISGIQYSHIGSDIVFTGVLKGEALDQVYQSADVFCLPSIEEGLALVLGEALSFGTPIIATENSGAEDIITHEHEGFIVPIKSSNTILEKLEILAHDEGKLADMRKAAQAKASQLQGWKVTKQNLVNTLKALCD